MACDFCPGGEILFLDLERNFNYDLNFKEIFQLKNLINTDENLFQKQFRTFYKRCIYIYSIFKLKCLYTF